MWLWVGGGWDNWERSKTFLLVPPLLLCEGTVNTWYFYFILLTAASQFGFLPVVDTINFLFKSLWTSAFSACKPLDILVWGFSLAAKLCSVWAFAKSKCCRVNATQEKSWINVWLQLVYKYPSSLPTQAVWLWDTILNQLPEFPSGTEFQLLIVTACYMIYP